MVEEQGVAGLEEGAYDRISGEPPNLLVAQGPVEVGTPLAGLDDAVEPFRDEVHPGRVAPAPGQRDPEVQGADALAEEGAILMPPLGAALGGQAP